MNSQDVKDVVKKWHMPKEMEKDHVFLVFNDGEICITKGGELFNRRTFHLRAAAAIPEEEAVIEFPLKSGEGKVKHTYATSTEEGVWRVRDALQQHYTEFCDICRPNRVKREVY